MDNPHLTVAKRPLAVTYRPVGTLVPSPHNARTHSKRQVDQIVASIREFGFTNSILIDPDTAEQNIWVTVICPGDIDTPMQESGYAGLGLGRDDWLAAIASTISMKRIGPFGGDRAQVKRSLSGSIRALSERSNALAKSWMPMDTDGDIGVEGGESCLFFFR